MADCLGQDLGSRQEMEKKKKKKGQRLPKTKTRAANKEAKTKDTPHCWHGILVVWFGMMEIC